MRENARPKPIGAPTIVVPGRVAPAKLGAFSALAEPGRRRAQVAGKALVPGGSASSSQMLGAAATAVAVGAGATIDDADVSTGGLGTGAPVPALHADVQHAINTAAVKLRIARTINRFDAAPPRSARLSGSITVTRAARDRRCLMGCP
ncbi:Hypothetical protein A7982_08179 [Minicystis rosea]|nr:Hypothetical protein A7982_08179 [Minicystis rosea]